MKFGSLALLILLSFLPLSAQNGPAIVIEEIVARVNNEIITRSDLTRGQAALRKEIEEECRGCAAAELERLFHEREKNLLRDLIDQSLLVQRGKDLGVNIEPDVIKRLDQIRQQNNFSTMEELERAVTASGTAFEEFKASIRNNLLTQEVIKREVGSRVIIGRDEVVKYYNEHKNEFYRPEQVYLREIFISTEGKSEAEIASLEQKARKLLERIRNGEEFAELAKRNSDGTTAQRGGELGVFERGQLAKQLEEAAFRMNRGEVTDVIRTKTGFLILKVEQRYQAGLQPVDKVEGEISNRIYIERMQPALRAYLAKLRQESYLGVKPGYVDTAAVASTPIVEVQPTREEPERKKSKKKKARK
jgi:peptidyl-prolyl cis-trans isomerase SurA